MSVDESMDTVDVVIPTIGRHSLLRAVRSAINQTVRTRVWVVLDRPDQRFTVERLLEGMRCEVLVTSGRQGGAVARNLGFTAGSSQCIAFLDDDDWWSPEFLRSRLEALHGPDDVEPDLVLGAFKHGNKDSDEGFVTVPRVAPPVEAPAKIPNYMLMRNRLKFGRNAVQTSSMLFRRCSLRAKPWDEHLEKHQDWDLVASLVANPAIRVAWDEAPLAHIEKDSPSSVSRRRNWRISYNWWRSRQVQFSRRASADFLFAHVLRAAIAQRNLTGILTMTKSLRGVPHFSALVIGLSAIVKK